MSARSRTNAGHRQDERESEQKKRGSQAVEHPLADLNASIGNRAVVDLLAVAQPKLAVGRSNDPAELEADRVASEVVAKLGGSHAGGTSCGDGCSHQAERSVARKSIGSAGGELSTEEEREVQAATSGGGRALPEQTRNEMEGAFGRDFGGVRIHADATAATLARSMSARAFTLGSHIFLGEGERVTDRSLMAHELTHTVQQTPRR